MRSLLFICVLSCFIGVQGFAQIPALGSIRDKIQNGQWQEVLNLSTSTLTHEVSAEDRALLFFAKGIAEFELGKNEDLQKSFEQVLSIKNNMHEYAYFYLGQSALRQGRIKESVEHFQKVESLSPNYKLMIDSKMKLAELFLKQGQFKKSKELLKFLDKKMKNDKDYPDVLWLNALTDKALHNLPSYCKSLKKLYSFHPEYASIRGWGIQLSENKVDGQKTSCMSSREDMKQRIRNLIWAGMTEEAKLEIEQYRKGMSEEESYDGDQLLAYYFIQEGDIQEAIHLLSKYYSSRKNDPMFLVQWGNAHARAGEMAIAIGAYDRAYKISPTGKHAKNNLYQSAYFSFQAQDYDHAQARFTTFIKKFPTSNLNKEAHWHLAWIQYLRGNYEEAYKKFSDVLTVKKKRRKERSSITQERVQYWMAMSLLKQNKQEDAKNIFERMAQDRGFGYYSILSKHRLSKILPLISNGKNRTQAKNGSSEITRFQYKDALPSIEEGSSSDETTAEGEAVAESDESVENVEESSDGVNASDAILPGDSTKTEDEEKIAFQSPELIQRFERARDLMILGLNDWAKWDLFDIEKKTSNKEYLRMLVSEYESVQHYHRSSSIAQLAFGGQRLKFGIDGIRHLWESAYPKAYGNYVFDYSKQFQVPFELVWGIMRAESQYRKDVISPVGALGLMQIMPYTGNRLAKVLNESNFQASDLLNPPVAVKYGARYLSRLMRKYDQNIALVAASYNAGPHRVQLWLKSFGSLDMDEFVEHIPFLETRNYVKRVVSNYYIYAQLYGQDKSPLVYLTEPLNLQKSGPLSTKETWEDI
jgi:soluble lytic murein transglycosylase